MKIKVVYSQGLHWLCGRNSEMKITEDFFSRDPTHHYILEESEIDLMSNKEK